MTVMPDTYLGHILEGRDPGDVDDWIDRWHEGQSRLELHEFLGMTFEEYGNFAANRATLEHIVAIRRLVEPARAAIAARAARERGRIN